MDWLKTGKFLPLISTVFPFLSTGYTLVVENKFCIEILIFRIFRVIATASAS
jgi:hypothetical protein